MISYLLEKEFKQFVRNPFLPKLTIFYPILIMLILPWVATLEVTNIKIAVIDSDHSSFSSNLTNKIEASTYFTLTALCYNHKEALEKVEKGTVDLILEIPHGFEKGIITGEGSDVQISVNAVNSVKGGLGGNYMSEIINSFVAEHTENQSIPLKIEVQNRYNPLLNYRFFMIPALMVVLVILLCGFMPALNIVGEKESGTIEQINVSPVGKFTFIIAKLIPYWIIGIVVMSLCILIAYLVYGLSPAGSVLLIYGISMLFILAMSGIGIIVSNYSHTLQQAMFLMFFIIMIFLLMSGLFTPVQTMPEWAQWIAGFIPPKYFIDIMRSIYLQGAGIDSLYPKILILAAFTLTSDLVAVISYKKRA